MSLTQSRKVRCLVGNSEEALQAIKKMNFPGLPVKVLSYPLGSPPFSYPKFEQFAGNEKDLLAAVDEAVRVSTIQKAILIGFPNYSNRRSV